MKNYYKDVVEDFGKEWKRFNYNDHSLMGELKKIYDNYFHIFPWELYNIDQSIGIDIGCGSGRWANFSADKVKKLILLDASSEALKVAKKNLEGKKNIEYLNQSAGSISIDTNSLDFAYSLGVLHHIPDLKSALIEINRILKPKSHLLLYLYYKFENKPIYYKLIWMLTNPFRAIISRLPSKIKFVLSELIALTLYLPLARFCKLLNKFNIPINNIPMYQYANLSYYIMRTDALDRFGTKVEKRYSKNEIESILEDCNFEKIQFSDKPPHWCVLAIKK